MKPIRKTMFSLLFDIETSQTPHQSVVVTAYFELEDNTINVLVKHSFYELPLYKHGRKKAEEVMSKLTGLKEIYSFSKDAISQVFPEYDGQKKVSEHYISPSFEGYMMEKFGVINIGNDLIPDNY